MTFLILHLYSYINNCLQQMENTQLYNSMMLELSNRLKRSDAMQLALQYQQWPAVSTQYILNIIDSADKSTAFHAAWVLEMMVWDKPADLLPVLPQFITSFAKTKNESVKRHYAKIMLRLTNREVVKTDIVNLLPIVEASFDWLINDKTRVAVKVHCIELLFNLSGNYPWILDDLPALVETQMQASSPAMMVAGKRLLNRLMKADAKRTIRAQ